MKKTNKFLYRFFYFIGIVLIIIGLSTIGLDFWNNYQESNKTNEDISSWESLPPPDESIAEGDLSEGEPTDSSFDNNAIWGVVTLDALNVKAPIAKEHNWDLLRKYVVAFEEGDLPSVEGGNYTLASHWGYSWCSYCYFRDIQDLKVGDIITVSDRKTLYTYEVFKNPTVILETDTDILNRIKDQTTLTLITCVTVKDPRRTVVQAKLISSTPR